MPPEQPPKWHPLQALEEPAPGHWELFDQYRRKYGDIRLVRHNGSLGYRTLVMNPHATAPADLGLLTTLREAVESIQRSWVSNHVSRQQGHTTYPAYAATPTKYADVPDRVERN